MGLHSHQGKKPRLIGDGTVSGANGCSRILEKTRLPTFESLQQFASRAEPHEAWSCLCFDVRGAHKLVRVRPEEQGLSCFVVQNKWFAHRSCYFGCRWAAYWFARVSALLVRLLHRYISVARGLFMYVDDRLVLLESRVAPFLAPSVLLFLVALGVPLSWEKIHLDMDRLEIGLASLHCSRA